MTPDSAQRGVSPGAMPASFWQICAEEALDEAGLTATEAQIAFMADAMESASEHWGQATGNDVASANWSAKRNREVAEARRELQEERDKVLCTRCGGSGKLTTSGGTMTCTSKCDKCDGHGRHAP